MNIWLVRPYKGEKSYLSEFKQDGINGIIGIGWKESGDLSSCKTFGEIKNRLEETLGEEYVSKELKFGKACNMIDMFVNRMNEGDYVLVPDKEDIYFCKISGEYKFEQSFDREYKHIREVEWLSNTLRKNLSTELRIALRVGRVVADLTKYMDEIMALAEGREYLSQKMPSTSNTNHTKFNNEFMNKNSKIETVQVSYPIRKDFDIRFQIPADLNKTEAKRLSIYFESMYFVE